MSTEASGGLAAVGGFAHVHAAVRSQGGVEAERSHGSQVKSQSASVPSLVVPADCCSKAACIIQAHTAFLSAFTLLLPQSWETGLLCYWGARNHYKWQKAIVSCFTGPVFPWSFPLLTAVIASCTEHFHTEESQDPLLSTSGVDFPI